MDIEEIYEEKGKINISSKECIHCYRCVELCPEEDCLSVAFLEKEFLRSKSPYRKPDGLKFLKKSPGNQIKPSTPNLPINKPQVYNINRSQPNQKQGPGGPNK
jgi:ferredoxin